MKAAVFCFLFCSINIYVDNFFQSQLKILSSGFTKVIKVMEVMEFVPYQPSNVADKQLIHEG